MKTEIITKKIFSTLILVLSILILASCNSTKEVLAISDKEKSAFEAVEGDAVTIADEETEYEITIIDPGFYTWLNTIARPEGYYSQAFLENRNQLLVTNWNQRVLIPNNFDPNLYQMQIDYQSGIDYGYEVNYKLYNYFIYFQRKYNQRLGPFVPRI